MIAAANCRVDDAVAPLVSALLSVHLPCAVSRRLLDDTKARQI